VTGDRASLRLRLFAMILAAALVPLAPLCIVVILQVRDAMYARSVADARERLAQIRSACVATGCAEVAAAGFKSAPCPARVQRDGEAIVLCENVAGGSIELRHDLRPVRQQLSSLSLRILATLALFVAMLVVLASWMLERGIARRVDTIDAALAAVGAENGGATLLPEGGDAVGRVGGAVNRLAQRLREERARTRAQIEELETTNRELREARADLARSEKLATVGRLAAGVAHEVGNPVSALVGYASLIRERLAQGRDVSEYAGRIERETRRIDRILRDLLDLARPPAQLQAIDLRRAVELARASVAPQQANVAFELELARDLPQVRGDEHYVSQIFVNLLSNAAHAGASRVRVSARAEPGTVIVEVEDDGAGIPPHALPRLFEPFFTTGEPGQGTGLGLALCHASMERFGGSISGANRRSGRGAVFELRFLSEAARRAG